MKENNLSRLRPFRNFSEYQAEFSLSKELPFWEFTEEATILADGSIVTALKLKGIAIETLDSDRINQFTTDLRSILNSLNDGMEIGLLSELNSDLEPLIKAHENEKDPNISPDIVWLSEHRTRKIRDQVAEQSLFKNNLYLFIYRRFSGETEKKSFFKRFFSAPKNFTETKKEEYGAALKELLQTKESLKVRFESIGLRATNLDSETTWRMIYRYLNPNRSISEPIPKLNKEYQTQEFKPEELQKCPNLTYPSPREQLVFSSLIQGYESFFLDGHYHRVITLKTLPEFTHSALMSRLQALPFHHRLYVHIQVPEQSKELSSLQAKRRMAHSMSLSQGGRATDLESESKLQATEELLRELINTGQKIFYFQCSILIHSKDKDDLNLMTKTILSRFREMNGAEGMNETVSTFKTWKTMLPFGNVGLVRPKRAKTDNLADLLPVYQSYEGPSHEQLKPVCLFQNRSLGLVAYDVYDSTLPNFSSLVTGASGSGKSFLNNLILLQYVIKRPLVNIIDIGGSYRKLCEFLSGQYIEVSPPKENESIRTINPFHLPDNATEPSPHKLKFLLTFFETILTDSESEKLHKLDKSLLEEAFLETYKKIRKEKDRVPRLSDFHEYLSASKETSLKNFAKMLYPWTGNRPYGRLLDADNTLDLTNDVVVFDLKGLSSYPDLQSVMILIITDFILGRVESKNTNILQRRKQIIMDEVWQLLQSKPASSFMEYCVRTLRKTGSGITFITQGLEEIVASPIGSAILSNTATKFILLQRGDLEPIRKILKLNDQEMSLIQSLGQSKGLYSEAFMMLNEDRTVIRIKPTPIEYWLATSDAIDNSYLDEYRKKYPEKTLPQVIEELASQFPFGVSKSEVKYAQTLQAA